jgi:hypothetical protein
MQLKIGGWFACNALLYMGASYLILLILNDPVLFHNSYRQVLDEDRIMNLLRTRESISYVSLIIIPIFLMMKYLIILCMMLSGKYLERIEISKGNLFQCIIQCDLIFIVPILIKYVLFEFVWHDYDLEEIQTYMPCSLAAVVGYDKIPRYLLYPLQSINLFEIVFIASLASSISKTIGSFKQALMFVTKYLCAAVHMLDGVIDVVQFVLNEKDNLFVADGRGDRDFGYPYR